MKENSKAMLEILQRRRSIRKFTPQKLSTEELETLQNAVLFAPTSRNLQPCEFYFVTDKNKITTLANVKSGGTTPLQTAPLAVVIAADPQKCDVWIEDSSIAAYTLLLQCEAMGLGAVWVQIRKRGIDGTDAEANVKRLLGLPDNLRVVSVICIGEKAEEKEERSFNSLYKEKIHIL